jgi:uncharacterized membrane protein
MSGVGFDLKRVLKKVPRSPNVNQAILFIVPSLVITGVSIILFSQLIALTPHQHNIFSITIIAAVILSLVGMAGMQLLIYRIVDDREYYLDGAAIRGIRVGIICSVIFSIVMSGLSSFYFVGVLNFSLTDFFYFSLLLFLYSATWVISSAFWASQQYKQPAVIFTFSYLLVFTLTHGAYLESPDYAITGYIGGIVVLFILSWLVAKVVFPKPKVNHKLSNDLSKMPRLASQNIVAILFNILYVCAIFLDKIIVWVSQGLISGENLVVTGTYTQGAFLGFIPMLSVAAIAYFASRTKSLVEDRYKGTFPEIQKRIKEYKHVYWTSLRGMLLTAVALFALGAIFSFRFIADAEVLRIMFTTSIGSLFFLVIIFNSTVLPIFGKSSISTLAVLAVIIGELLSIPFVTSDIWYSSLGFLVGSFAGFLITFLFTIRLFSGFEYNIFRFVCFNFTQKI